jgi:SH3-like domain-containing protein
MGTIMKPVKRKVIADYKSPYPESIRFKKGEPVRIVEKFDKDSDWDNWYWSEGKHGKKAWVPIQYIDIDGDKATINTPYDAKELTIHKGEILKTFEEINGFTMAINSKGMKGWAPLKNLRPVIE